MRPVVVIGAGPAGLMAAQAASDAGAKVIVVEAKRTAGRKFLVAGKGGLNLTHSEPLDAFVARYREASARLEPHLRAFPPERLRAFVDALGQATWIGSSGRVFPKDAKAAPLLRTWISRLKRSGVELRTRSRWSGFARGALVLDTGPLECGACVLAVGGGSWPDTGSDGSWVPILRGAGIAVRDLAPSNCGFEVAWPDAFLAKAEGKVLKNVALTVAGETARGDVTVTKTGIEGSAVYRLSPLLRAIAPGEVSLDLKPDLEPERVAAKLATKSLKLDGVVKALLSGRKLDVATVKSFAIRIERPRPLAEAISSAGGISWEELDPTLMLRRLPGVFTAGEMIDWEAPTGGYLLQACFATGHVSGLAAARWAGEHRD